MIEFASSSWLWALPAGLIVFIMLYLRTAAARQRIFRLFAGARGGFHASASYSPMRQRMKEVLALAAFSLLVLALARPQWGADWRETRARGVDIIFAVDVSRSMLAQDITPNRLDRAKLAIRDLVREMDGDRLGLIPFAGSAFLQTPLTHDYNAFLQSLDSLRPGIIPRGGTNIAAAIDEAISAFGPGDNYRFLILISDGEDLAADGIAAATRAARENVRIFAVGVGSPEGARIPVQDSRGRPDFLRDSYGNIVVTRLDENTLQRIAAETGAFYVPLGPRGEGMRTVLEAGRQEVPQSELESRMERIPVERFQIFLALALALLVAELLLTNRNRGRSLATTETPRSGSAAAAALVALMLASLTVTPVDAARAADAWRLFSEGDYQGAERLFESLAEAEPDNRQLRYNQGIAAYRSGDFNRAARLFERALPTTDFDLQADVFYNLGNTHFRLGEGAITGNPGLARDHWMEALRHYRNAMELRPGDPNAEYNHDVVEELLRQLEEQMQAQQQEESDSGTDPEDGEGQTGRNGRPDNRTDPDQGNDSGEDADASAEQPQADMRETAPEEQANDEGRRRMSRLEAEQILDALRQRERILPMSGLDDAEPADSPGVERDW